MTNNGALPLGPTLRQQNTRLDCLSEADFVGENLAPFESGGAEREEGPLESGGDLDLPEHLRVPTRAYQRLRR